MVAQAIVAYPSLCIVIILKLGANIANWEKVNGEDGVLVRAVNA